MAAVAQMGRECMHEAAPEPGIELACYPVHQHRGTENDKPK